MATHKIPYTGQQIDEAIKKAINSAPVNSPTFTGTPKATTPAKGNNSTQIATTAFVQTAIGDIETVLDKINGEVL